jgi:hypothetical protein
VRIKDISTSYHDSVELPVCNNSEKIQLRSKYSITPNKYYAAPNILQLQINTVQLQINTVQLKILYHS